MSNKTDEPIAYTLFASWAATTTLSPCSYAVNDWTLKAATDKEAKQRQALQYFAKPVDAIIQALAMPILTVIDHFRDACRGSIAEKVVKWVFTPAALAVKIFISLFASAGYLFNGLIQLGIPYSMINGIMKGKQAAQRFFYELDTIKSEFTHHVYDNGIKPLLAFEAKKHHLEQNPFLQKKNELVETIKDPQYKVRVCKELVTPKPMKDLENKLMIRALMHQSHRDGRTKRRPPNDYEHALAITNKLAPWRESQEQAAEVWKKIDGLSDYSFFVQNSGMPFVINWLRASTQTST